jgi:hypothetical protein
VGATQRTLAVRTSDYGEIKARLVRWLAAKGFDPTTSPALFRHDHEHDDERGLCLFSNGSWVVVLYSHMFHEVDRVRFELTRPDWPLLCIWTYDSDIWGYELFDDDRPIAAFNSNPHYFGYDAEAETPPGVEGDPELLCRVLQLGPVEEVIARLQRKGTTFRFSEHVCHEFCQAIGVEPAAHDYHDLEGLPPLSATAAGWQIDHIRFVERGASASEAARPLHAMVRRPLIRDEAAIELAAELNARLWPLRAFLHAIMLLVKPLVLALRIWFRLAMLIQRLPFVGRRYEQSRNEWENSAFATLLAQIRPPIRREGATLINDNHRCQITLPAGVEVDDGPWFWPSVFQIKVAGSGASCYAIRPGSMHQRLREMPDTQITDEECFFAGTLQARAWTHVYTGGRAVMEQYSLIVQTPRAFYEFTLRGDGTPFADAKRIIRSIGESFRLSAGEGVDPGH